MLDLDYTVKVRLPITIFAVLITYGTVFWASTPTRKGYGYEPEQPIAYSHKLHAGDMQIDCRYCHIGADKSRHAVVPSVDTCMNCHNTVKAVGRDPSAFTYLIVKSELKDNPEKAAADKTKQLERLLPVGSTLEDVIASIEKVRSVKKDSVLLKDVSKAKSIEDVAKTLDGIISNPEAREKFLSVYGSVEDADVLELKKKGALDEKDSQKLCRLVMDSLFNIDNYYSKELKKLRGYYESGKPVVWKRLYHLPEYAYFNHSVHVNKGIDCTFCHGNVADLDSMKKMKPITMGRCIDCHRGDYQEYHKTIKDSERVAGPENCGACHR